MLNRRKRRCWNLPYAGTMIFFFHARAAYGHGDASNLAALEQSLIPDKLYAWIRSLALTEVQLWLPKVQDEFGVS